MAMTGAARRLDITATHQVTADGFHVAIRDDDTVAMLLERLGAPAARTAWTQHRAQSTTISRRVGRIANFDTANAQRSRISSVIAVARVQRAFDILDATCPTPLAEAGHLRLAHPEATLEDLGRRATPPVTKDTKSGRLRRLLLLADAHAQRTGVAGTESAVTAELSDEQ